MKITIGGGIDEFSYLICDCLRVVVVLVRFFFLFGGWGAPQGTLFIEVRGQGNGGTGAVMGYIDPNTE